VERESREAAREWSQSTFLERRAVLQEISDWILANPETISTWSVNDNGKTVSESNLTEIMTSLEKLRWIIAHGSKALAREGRPVASLLAFGKKAYIEYSPLGVIGVIVPWNHPFHNVLSAVAAAIFAGNGCVCKVLS
jgi:acyl-CoA reductase-like NAD-dependent aldehyde dehydrogenase